MPRRSFERSSRLYTLEFLSSSVKERIVVAVVRIEARSSKSGSAAEPEKDVAIEEVVSVVGAVVLS